MKFPVFVLAAFVLSACSKKDPAPPERTEPWLAQAPSATSAPSRGTAYRIDERGVARLSLKARDATPKGELRVARGELTIHLQDLSRSRGTISMDVASVSMLEGGDAGARDTTHAARNWLNVGSNRPETEIDRVRWASFEITRIEEVSTDSAAAGRKVKLTRRADADAGDAGADGGDAAVIASEARSVRLVASGALSFNGLRVDRRVSLEVIFYWRPGTNTDAPPASLSIKTRRAFVVELAAHDVAPRDETGRRTPTEDKLLGRMVGREARVELELGAKLADK